MPIKFKNIHNDFEYYKNSQNCELSQKIKYDLDIEYRYYWNFSSIGIHTVKIIFKKKLLQCNKLFYGCPYIYKIVALILIALKFLIVLKCLVLIDLLFLFY